MDRSTKLVLARALAETYSEEELKKKRISCLEAGMNGRVTSWADVGLSSSISYDFNVVTAVDVLTAAIDMLQGKCVGRSGDRIRKFVL